MVEYSGVVNGTTLDYNYNLDIPVNSGFSISNFSVQKDASGAFYIYAKATNPSLYSITLTAHYGVSNDEIPEDLNSIYQIKIMPKQERDIIIPLEEVMGNSYVHVLFSSDLGKATKLFSKKIPLKTATGYVFLPNKVISLFNSVFYQGKNITILWGHVIAVLLVFMALNLYKIRKED